MASPEDLWTVSSTGGSPHILTALRENQPDLVWDSDGTALFVIGAVALYRVELPSGLLTEIGAGATGGSIAYLAR